MELSSNLKLKSGRQIAVHLLARGQRQRTVVFCHPSPGAGNLDPDPEETAKRQITLIAVERPGYGASEPVAANEWASVDSAADDLAELLQTEQSAPVGIVGWSAGGRVALAVAARHPDIVDRVVIIATPAPDEIVPWIPVEQKHVLQSLIHLPPGEVHRRLTEQFENMLPKNAKDEALLTLLGRSPADDEALEDPNATERLLHMLRAAFAQGAVGLASDIAGYSLRPWGFTPADVHAKTVCLYGSRDPIVGSRHGAWWQRNLPDARLEVAPGAGHLLVIPMWKRVLSHLAPGKL